MTGYLPCKIELTSRHYPYHDSLVIKMYIFFLTVNAIPKVVICSMTIYKSSGALILIS